MPRRRCSVDKKSFDQNANTGYPHLGHWNIAPEQAQELSTKHTHLEQRMAELTQVRSIASVLTVLIGKMYLCKCGMVFDSADKFKNK